MAPGISSHGAGDGVVARRTRYTRNLGRRAVEPLPARRPDAKYVRFEHPSERLGLFVYVDEARKSLDDEQGAELDALIGWFNEHLQAPSRMVPFRSVGVRAHRRRWAETSAIRWFRVEAVQHLVRARRLAELVRGAGIAIVERTISRIPGKICSEDEFQIAVEAYRDAQRQ